MAEAPIRLHFLDLHSSGDPIRALLHLKKVSFEDKVISFPEWDKVKGAGVYKSDTLPVLEIDGFVLEQARAILKYLGSKFSMNPTDSYTDYLVDFYHDCLDDTYQEFYFKYLFTTGDVKADAEKRFFEKTMPVLLAKFEKTFLDEKGDLTGYLVDGQLSTADFKMCCYMDVWMMNPKRRELGEPVLKEFAPNLLRYIEQKIGGEFSEYFGDSAKRPPRTK
eukprot:CAMPEP_0115007106 /NCGR_PEP_ID=MMETSP0216-20121206/20946_1 /TAXON_ID=223996 /ORGANISM="Protocruzia adherens, Strain Boccale" /LENGTH=219 /DNA_ID=CAMNT_0002373913 /DNA_START=61 /DNA_END=720 /DNA_ORIENTATION=-